MSANGPTPNAKQLLAKLVQPDLDAAQAKLDTAKALRANSKSKSNLEVDLEQQSTTAPGSNSGPPLLASPLLNDQALAAVAAGKYPMATSNRYLEGRIYEEVKRDAERFLAAQDRDALASEVALLLTKTTPVVVTANVRAVIDALLGPAKEASAAT